MYILFLVIVLILLLTAIRKARNYIEVLIVLLILIITKMQKILTKYLVQINLGENKIYSLKTISNKSFKPTEVFNYNSTFKIKYILSNISTLNSFNVECFLKYLWLFYKIYTKQFSVDISAFQ